MAATCIVGAAVNLVSLLFYLVAVRWRAQAEKTWTTSATSTTSGKAGDDVGKAAGDVGEAGEAAVGGTEGVGGTGGVGDTGPCSDGVSATAVVLHSAGGEVELVGN